MNSSVNSPVTVRGKIVFVGLSGGVDSAVTAALLQEAGAHVTGVFIKGWYPPGMPCTWAHDRRDAMRVAAQLRIPFRTLDASAEYKKGVIDYLLSEYKAGRTPNPDVMCNREVKFGAFYRYAMNEGVDFIATGHYAVRDEDSNGPRLRRGPDENKDQSYFLWAVPKNALAKTLFPVGNLPKSRVRTLAQQFKLPNAHKRDSQGICFLGTISVENFLRKEFGSTQGRAIDETGNDLGMHDGALLYTLGERIRLTDAPPGPWYVLRKDIEQNILTVSKNSTQRLLTTVTSKAAQEIYLTETNFFHTPQQNQIYEAQYRYHGQRIPGTYNPKTSAFTPSVPLLDTVAPGQSLVLYDNDVCIGGGIIA